MVDFPHTEHVLQAHDAGQVVIKVDVIVGIGKPQADQLQQAVVQLHAFIWSIAAFASELIFSVMNMQKHCWTHLQLWVQCEAHRRTFSPSGRCQKTRRASETRAGLNIPSIFKTPTNSTQHHNDLHIVYNNFILFIFEIQYFTNFYTKPFVYWNLILFYDIISSFY